MLFNSYIFWLFFSGVLITDRIIPNNARNFMLLVASYVFYGYWDWRLLLLIFPSTVFDFYVSRLISKQVNSKIRSILLGASLGINLCLLGFFKYFDFFVSELLRFFLNFGLHLPVHVLNIVLPVGISFYTFQKLGYMMDVYRGEVKPAGYFVDFALFVCFFPLLLAGPIERYSHLMPQIMRRRVCSRNDFEVGLFLIISGLFKKTVIADNLSPIVKSVFWADPHNLSGAEGLVGVYAFAFQIYADFSGYSSIAQGVAKWMGFDLSWNFRMPYFAVSPSDFWRRWHISLSSWFRDYLYIPLGGNRVSRRRHFVNLALTMALVGLWHGAAWTFILWGLYHGILLVAYHIFDGNNTTKHKTYSTKPEKWSVIRALVLFHFVCIGWLFFRAESLRQAWVMLVQIVTRFHVTHFFSFSFGMIAFFVAPLLVLEFYCFRSEDMLKVVQANWKIRGLTYAYMVLMIIIFQPIVANEFIYFQF